MKKVFLSFIIFASIAISANAQQRGITEKRGQQLGFSAKELNLTDEQKNKIKNINEDYKNKTFTLRSDSTLTKEQRREKIQELRKEQRLAANNILTSDQQSKLKEIRGKRAGKDSSQKNITQHRRKLNHGMRDTFKGLNLTDEQKSQIHKLNDEFRKKNREEMNAHKEAIAKVLTPQQRDELKNRQGEQKSKAHRGQKLDPETAKKLEVLKADFLKNKKAVEMSRIAPEEQTRRIDVLKEKYIEDRIQIKNSATQTKKQNVQ